MDSVDYNICLLSNLIERKSCVVKKEIIFKLINHPFCVLLVVILLFKMSTFSASAENLSTTDTQVSENKPKQNCFQRRIITFIRSGVYACCLCDSTGQTYFNCTIYL